MTDKELIRRALMGEKRAQEECTQKRIALPCPFCGSENIVISNWGLWRVWCQVCLGKSDDQLSQADAIRKWNTRPALPVIHAKWEWHGPCRDNKGTYWATCTACGIRQRLGDYENYCPKCGARMDLEGDEQ